MRAQPGRTVLLSDGASASSLAARLASSNRPVPWYASVEDLLKERSLASVEVLVLHCRPEPQGVLLTHLGRMNVEYPGMQKVAVLEGIPPLPIAEYLTACGVDLLWTASMEGNTDRLASVVSRMQQRTPWITMLDT